MEWPRTAIESEKPKREILVYPSPRGVELRRHRRLEKGVMK
jgi:hypothetical protein